MNEFWCCCTALHLVPRLSCFPQNQSIDPDWPPSFAARPFPPSSRVASHSSGFLGMIGLRMPATPATRFSRFSHPKWSKSCGRNLEIILKQKWGLPKMGVPKSSILEGFSTVNTPFLGMETPILNPVMSLWTLNSIGITAADQMNPVADLQPRGKWIQMEVCNISPGEPFPATKRDVLLPLSDKNLLLWTRICMMFCSSNCWFKKNTDFAWPPPYAQSPWKSHVFQELQQSNSKTASAWAELLGAIHHPRWVASCWPLQVRDFVKSSWCWPSGQTWLAWKSPIYSDIPIEWPIYSGCPSCTSQLAIFDCRRVIMFANQSHTSLI